MINKQDEAGRKPGNTPLGARGEGDTSSGGFIYNVTIKVEPSIAERWLEWLLKEHIPEIMATNCFVDYRVVKILEIDESEGPTYAIQFHASSKGHYQDYTDKFAGSLRDKSFAKWGDRFIAFRTIMEIVN